MKGIVILLFVAASACHHGTRPERLILANGPQGAEVAVRLRGEVGDRVGELFAVDSSGVIIRMQALVRIGWPAVEAMDVDKFGDSYDVARGETVTPDKRAKLALLSRFPQGLGGPLLAAVLQKLGQGALVEVR